MERRKRVSFAMPYRRCWKSSQGSPVRRRSRSIVATRRNCKPFSLRRLDLSGRIVAAHHRITSPTSCWKRWSRCLSGASLQHRTSRWIPQEEQPLLRRKGTSGLSWRKLIIFPRTFICSTWSKESKSEGSGSLPWRFGETMSCVLAGCIRNPFLANWWETSWSISDAWWSVGANKYMSSM